jgi:diadenosine tetraphosphate (Ap4A) HIT family hydrolase
VFEPAQCPFCTPLADPHQHIVFETTYCYYLQHDHHQDVLEGTGVIVPKAHRETTFDLTPEEWQDIYTLLQKAKPHLEQQCGPDGYTLGWNVGLVSNQEIPHAHFHVVPRFADEPHAGKGLRHWLKQEDNRRKGRR